MENTIESKQEYLSKEILDKGYNSDKFLTLLKSKKGENGDNLDKWTPEELEEAVKQFQRDNGAEGEEDQPKKTEAQTEPQMSERPKEENPFSHQVTNTMQSQDIPSSYRTGRLTTNFVNMEEEVSCQLPEQTELSGIDDLDIKLSFPEKRKEGSGISKKFMVYFLVEAQPKGYSVRRSAQDFVWLREVLKKFYPGIFIPPINNKELSESDSDEKVTKRMTGCNYFIMEIAKDPLLKNSKIFYDFLTTPSEKEFKLKRKAYDKMDPPKTINEVRTRTGKINLDGSIFEDGKRFDQSKENVKQNITIMSKLNLALKNLVKEMRTVGNRLNEISEYFESLSAQAKLYPDNQRTLQTFTALKSLFNDWSYAKRKQAMTFELEFKQYFKYINKEYKSLSELLTNFETSKSDYLKEKSKLQKKKEDLFKKQEIKKWNLPPEDTNIDLGNKTLCFEKMLPQETTHLEQMKKFCCFYGNFFESEFYRRKSQIEGLNQKMMESFYKKHYGISKEIVGIWENLSNYKTLQF